jgi:hypothetical protein
MQIFNIHTNIQQKKRLLIEKLWEELAGQMTYPIICNIHFQKRGKTSSQSGRNGLKFYHSLEIFTNMLITKFHFDMGKWNFMKVWVENSERTDERMNI